MNSRAFTIIELLISVAIFAAMTGLVVAKYGNFNQSVLLTNLAYDVALTIRTAQTYGLSVKNSDAGSGTDFQSGYGVRLDTNTGYNQEIIFFADRDNSGTYTNNTELISTYAVKRGAIIKGVCLLDASTCTPSQGSYLDIVFKRPNPDALMKIDGICPVTVCSYAGISVMATDGGVRTISVRENGQISVNE